MGRQLARLAVAQIVLIVYAIFSAGVFLKIRFGTSHPAVTEGSTGTYDLWLRNYGLWLFAVPMVWSVICFWRMRQPSGDADTFTNLYVAGIVLCIPLFFVAVGAAGVLISGDVVVTKPDQSGLIHSQSETQTP